MSDITLINMQDRRPPVLRGNHVHTCPECSTHVPCEDACGCFEDMRLDDGTERGGFVICEECRRLVPCPVCGGQGQLSYQGPGGCQCCMGAGKITAARDARLAGIRRDIAARLAGA